MRTLVIAILILLLLAIAISADVPAFISYQGRLTDDAGNPITGTMNIKFKIYGSPGGDDSLWSSGFQSVDVEDGLFNYKLGSQVPLTEELFITNDSRYLGITVESEAEMDPRTQFITTAYAYHSAYADTADYAYSSPGGASTGWVDDGSVIRLVDNTDHVGIGTSTPSEPLVVGKDLGEQNGDYIVIGNDTPDRLSGLKMGEDTDNYGIYIWGNNDNGLSWRTKEGGAWKPAMYFMNGNLGLGGTGAYNPSEPLVVGRNLGEQNGDYIVIGNNTPDELSGLKMGEDENNYGVYIWGNNDNGLSWRTKEDGVWKSAMCFMNGNLGIGGTGAYNPSEPLVVGRDLGSFAGNRIVVGDQTPGAYAGIMMGEDHDNRAFLTWSVDGNYFDIGIEDEGTQWSQMIKLQDGETKIGIGSGNSSVQLPNNAVSSAEILNEAGLQSSERTSTYTITESWGGILSVTLDFPASGYVIVLASAELHYHKYENEDSPILAFGIINHTGVAPHAYTYGYTEAASIEEWYIPITIHEVFSVTAGTEAFQFLAKVASGWCCSSQTTDARMTVIYVPTSYAFSKAASTDATDQSDMIALPQVYSTEAVPAETISNANSDANKIEALRTEFEGEIRALREEIAELKQNQ